MKLSQIAGASLLTLGLAILPATLPASATDTTGTTDTTGSVDTTDQATDGNYADGDWGLLGLLGLFGLFGRRSHKDETTRYEDPIVTRSTTNR